MREAATPGVEYLVAGGSVVLIGASTWLCVVVVVMALLGGPQSAMG